LNFYLDHSSHIKPSVYELQEGVIAFINNGERMKMHLYKGIWTNFGSRWCKPIDDGWALKVRNGEIAAYFQNALRVKKDGSLILTDFE